MKNVSKTMKIWGQIEVKNSEKEDPRYAKIVSLKYFGCAVDILCSLANLETCLEKFEGDIYGRD